MARCLVNDHRTSRSRSLRAGPRVGPVVLRGLVGCAILKAVRLHAWRRERRMCAATDTVQEPTPGPRDSGPGQADSRARCAAPSLTTAYHRLTSTGRYPSLPARAGLEGPAHGIRPGPMGLCHSSASCRQHHLGAGTQEGWGGAAAFAWCWPGGWGRTGRLLTINVALLLAVIVFFRLRRRTEARSRADEKMTVVIVLALGILIAPTPAGQGIFHFVEQLAGGITQASR